MTSASTLRFRLARSPFSEFVQLLSLSKQNTRTTTDNLNDVTGFQSWTKTRLGRAVLTWLAVFSGLMAVAFVYGGLK